MYTKKALMVRLPEDLHTKVVARAEEAGLSMNQWITLVLTSALDGDQLPVTITSTTEYRL